MLIVMSELCVIGNVYKSYAAYNSSHVLIVIFMSQELLVMSMSHVLHAKFGVMSYANCNVM